MSLGFGVFLALAIRGFSVSSRWRFRLSEVSQLRRLGFDDSALAIWSRRFGVDDSASTPWSWRFGLGDLALGLAIWFQLRRFGFDALGLAIWI